MKISQTTHEGLLTSAPMRSEHTDSSPAPATSPDSPVELELGDGSRLVLDEATASPILCRLDGEQTRETPVSLDEAMRLSGQPFAGYRLLR
jgi:hypothetical protein